MDACTAYELGYSDAIKSKRPHSPIFCGEDYIEGYADASMERDMLWKSIRAHSDAGNA